jgi:hypothetical protein
MLTGVINLRSLVASKALERCFAAAAFDNSWPTNRELWSLTRFSCVLSQETRSFSF